MKSLSNRIPPLDLLLSITLGLLGAWIGFGLPDPKTLNTSLGQFLVFDARDLSFYFITGAVLILGLHRVGPAAGVSLPSWRKLIPVGISVGFAAYFCYDRIAATKTTILPWPGGERFFWLDDDMMITMRYALNFARGEGLVWNPGESPVEGITNFLWAFVLSIPHFLGLPLRLTSGFVIATNCLLLAGILCLAWTLGRSMGIRPALRFLALLLIASNRWVIYWTVGGSESLLLAFLILLVSQVMLNSRTHKKFGVLGGLTIGLIALTRSDGLVIVLGFIPALWCLHKSGRLKISALAIPTAMIVAQFGFRLIYYGELFPNTYYLKSVDLPMKEAMGLHYIHFLFLRFGGVCVLQLASLQLARSPLARSLAVIPWFVIGYVTLMGGDELGEFRFIVPVFPALLLGAMLSAQTILTRPRATSLGRRQSHGVPVYGWVMIVFIISTFRSVLLPNSLADLGVERAYHEKNNVRIGLLLNRNTTPDARISHYWAGAAPYFSERHAYDLLGKNDPYIARLPGRQGEWVPGHNKYDTRYSLTQKPDVIVTAGPGSWTDPNVRLKEPLRQSYPSLFDLYGHPDFRAIYQPNAISSELTYNYHEVFLRNGSPHVKPPNQWQ